MLRSKFTLNLRGSDDNILLRRLINKYNSNNMSDTFKFPNGGYDVTVVRKQDIIDCLDANVVDKDVVLAVISQCELDAANFISSGRWTGIPFIGSIRVPKRIQRIHSKEVQDLIEEAKNTLDKDRYLVFRHRLGSDINREERENRYYRYIVSHFVNNNRKFYNKLVKKEGEDVAQFICYTLSNLTIGEHKKTL